MTKILLLLISLSCLATPAVYAQQTEKQFWLKTFHGWGGIAVQCEAKDSQLTKNICAEIASNVEYLAAVAKIPFVYTGRSSSFEHHVKIHQAKLKHPIDLVVSVRHTDGSDPTSIYASISASAFYTDTIETKAGKAEPTALPKSGTLTFYSRDALGHGPRSTIGSQIADALRKPVQSLMTLYVKHHKPMP